MQFTKPPLIATLLTLCGTAILCTLGTWQLQRLEWKTEIIAALQTEQKKDPAQHPIQLQTLKENMIATRGTLSGTYLFNKEFNLIPRANESIAGKDVITPLKLNDGTIILVNRGWAPLTWDNKETGQKQATLTGTLRKIPSGNIFTPENIPEQNQWYHIKIKDIKKAKNLTTIAPYIFNLEEDGLKTDNSPQPLSNQKALNNNHMQYALFWFTMAGAFIAIFILRFVKKP